MNLTVSFYEIEIVKVYVITMCLWSTNQIYLSTMYSTLFVVISDLVVNTNWDYYLRANRRQKFESHCQDCLKSEVKSSSDWSILLMSSDLDIQWESIITCTKRNNLKKLWDFEKCCKFSHETEIMPAHSRYFTLHLIQKLFL